MRKWIASSLTVPKFAEAVCLLPDEDAYASLPLSTPAHTTTGNMLVGFLRCVESLEDNFGFGLDPGQRTNQNFEQLFQVASVVLAGAESFVLQEPEVKRDGGLDSLQAVLAQGAAGTGCG